MVVIIINTIIFDNKIFKKYDSMYYVSSDGQIYSFYKNGILKHYIDIDGYHRVDIHGEHIKVHRLVYHVWINKLKENEQINHKDDNKNNNNVINLYSGTQKDNIDDCFKNNHRVGNVKCILIYDKLENKIIRFPNCKEFLEYSGHPQKNGSFSRCKK